MVRAKNRESPCIAPRNTCCGNACFGEQDGERALWYLCALVLRLASLSSAETSFVLLLIDRFLGRGLGRGKKRQRARNAGKGKETRNRARSIRPKFPQIPVQNWMEHKFSRNSFFRKFGNSGISCFIWHFYISTRFESAPVSLVAESYRMAASLTSRHYNGCKISVKLRACSWSKTKTLGSDFLENCGLVVPNFLWVSSPGLHTLPREKFVTFSRKYQELNSKRFLNFSTWSSLTRP